MLETSEIYQTSSQRHTREKQYPPLMRVSRRNSSLSTSDIIFPSTSPAPAFPSSSSKLKVTTSGHHLLPLPAHPGDFASKASILHSKSGRTCDNGEGIVPKKEARAKLLVCQKNDELRRYADERLFSIPSQRHGQEDLDQSSYLMPMLQQYHDYQAHHAAVAQFAFSAAHRHLQGAYTSTVLTQDADRPTRVSLVQEVDRPASPNRKENVPVNEATTLIAAAAEAAAEIAVAAHISGTLGNCDDTYGSIHLLTGCKLKQPNVERWGRVLQSVELEDYRQSEERQRKENIRRSAVGQQQVVEDLQGEDLQAQEIATRFAALHEQNQASREDLQKQRAEVANLGRMVRNLCESMVDLRQYTTSSKLRASTSVRTMRGLPANLQGVELRQSPTLRQQGGANGIYTNKKYDDNGKHYMNQITMKRF